MQQSSATQSLHLSFWELRKIVACSHSSSQCLLVSIVFGTVTSLHPTSFLMIFILVVIVLRVESTFSAWSITKCITRMKNYLVLHGGQLTCLSLLWSRMEGRSACLELKS